MIASVSLRTCPGDEMLCAKKADTRQTCPEPVS